MFAPALLALAVTLSPSEVRVIDGDTFEARGVVYRVRTLDAPEVGARADCDGERTLGQAATEAAAELLSAPRAAEVTVTPKARDFRGRVVAEVAVDGQDFTSLMIAAGHGAKWRGRKRDWCALPAQP